MAIGLVGSLYVITTWLLVGTQGGERAGEVAAADPGNFVFVAFDSVLGGWSVHVATWFLLSSLMAVLLALHNMSSRYLLAMGRERALPPVLAQTHPRYQTPYVAGLVQAGLVFAAGIVYVLTGADPYLDLAAQTAGVGTLAVICLMAASSFSVPAFFLRRGEARLLPHVVAPVVAGLVLCYFAYLIVSNYSLITGSTSDVVNRLPWVLPVVAVIGFVIGLRQHSRTPIDMADATSR